MGAYKARNLPENSMWTGTVVLLPEWRGLAPGVVIHEELTAIEDPARPARTENVPLASAHKPSPTQDLCLEGGRLPVENSIRDF
jgi:hypothetical protein